MCSSDLLALSTRSGGANTWKPLEGPGQRIGRGPHAERGGCAEGPVPAAGLVRAGELSQAAACILFWHSARASSGEGLSQPLQASPSWHLTWCHSPLPWPSTICKGVLPGQCQRYPLYWHHCSIQPQHGRGGQRDGGGVPSACWRLVGVTGRAQHPLLTDARHPWEPAPMVPLNTRQ